VGFGTAGQGREMEEAVDDAFGVFGSAVECRLCLIVKTLFYEVICFFGAVAKTICGRLEIFGDLSCA
jgi:hypothetical protein